MNDQLMNADDYILKNYQSYNIIGLGEGGHGLENFHKFVRELFDNKKIQETIDIVIVEFANSAYQDILDRYIFGEDINKNELQIIWRESSVSPGRLGELPVYFQLLNKIRDVNRHLPRNKKIRVLGGDPPINWKTINNLEDYKKQIGYARETYPAELAIQYGINQDKKILVICSEYHLTKIIDHPFIPNYPSIASSVNKIHPGAMKTIGTIYSETFLSEPELKKFPINSIIDLKNDELGNLSGDKFFQGSIYKDGKEIKQFEKYKINELFDALLYVGQFDTLKRCSMPEPDFDDETLQELNRRRSLIGMSKIPKN